MDEIIYEGRIATSDESFKGQIVISKESGLITRVVNLDMESSDLKADKVFSDECVIFPGMGDIHVHAREDDTGLQNYKEDYATACNAALNGGVVHIFAMPNTPNPLVSEKELKWHTNSVMELNSPVTILNYVGIGPGTKPVEGLVAYKVYTGPSVGPLFFKNEAELRETMQYYREKYVSFHVEDFDILRKSDGELTHSKRRPVECVEVALKYVLEIISEFNIKAKLCHWSTGGKSFEMIREYRDKGCDITLEVSPLHLLFDSDILEEKPHLWPYVQMNPAIQSKEHREQLIEGLRSGFIDYIATDHAPHTLDEKFKNFEGYKSDYPNLSNEEIYRKILEENPDLCKEICCMNGASGASWLDTYTLVCTYLVKMHGFTYNDIARVSGKNPGDFVNTFLDESYGNGFGEIKEGYMGCLSVINFNKPQVLKRNFIKSKCGWSALEGWEFSGSLECVIVKGKELKNK